MNVTQYEKSFLKDLLYQMLLIRHFDLQAVFMRQQGYIPGFIHPSEGEEATAVGACTALKKSDVIVSNHRGHAHHLAKGGDPRTTMAELMGKVDGACHGHGGSLHVADYEIGNIGANGIVGGGIPIGVGAALAFYMAKEDRISLVFFGDGASNQGTFHEAANLAATWKLPVIFFCENNHYGEGTSQSRHMAIQKISQRAISYGFPGITVDGNNVIEVYEATLEAVERARKGEGPTLIEGETDRLCGAYEGDPQYYRTKEEVAKCREKDPIFRLKQALLDSGKFKESELEEIETDAKAQISAAIEFGKTNPKPKPEDALEFVYVNSHGGQVF